MRLLFDQNLPPRLVSSLADLYPDSKHVREVGLQSATDEAIWARAARDGFIIVTKDDDFRQRAFLFGAPPQVIWVRLGNCTAAEVEAVLRERYETVDAFHRDPTGSLLVLGRSGSR